MTVLQPGELLTAIRIPGDVGRSAVLLREGARPPGVGLPAGQRGVGDGHVGRDDPEHARSWSTAWRRGRCAWAVEQSCKGKPRNEETAAAAGEMAIEGAQPLRYNAYKVPLMRNLVKRAIRGVECMDYFLTWGRSPWGQQILTHVSWNLFWASLFAGVAVPRRARELHGPLGAPQARRRRDRRAGSDAPGPAAADQAPLARWRAPFHWVMAASMFTLLLTAFLPIVGVRFAWVTWHWMAGLVLATSILFHIIHATFLLDFWSIWVGPKDIPELRAEIMRELGHDVPGPKPGKYPLGNRLYHLAIVVAGLSVIATGMMMMVRVRTPLFTRNPYLLGDATWGLIYVTHGMAGVGLVGLVIAHVYFAVRPEKWWITKAMILGWITRRQYLEHHDPQRWVVGRNPKPQIPNAKSQVAQ